MPPDDALMSIALTVGAIIAGGIGLASILGVLLSYVPTRRSGWVAASAALIATAFVGAGVWTLGRVADLDEKRQVEALDARTESLVEETRRFTEALEVLAEVPDEVLASCNVPLRDAAIAFDYFRASADDLRDSMTQSRRLIAGNPGDAPPSGSRQRRSRNAGGRELTWAPVPGACELTRAGGERRRMRDHLRYRADRLELSAGVLGEHFEGREFPLEEMERWALPVYGALSQGAKVLLLFTLLTLAVVAYVAVRNRAFRRGDMVILLVGLLLLAGSVWLHWRSSSAPEATAITTLHHRIRITHGWSVELRQLFAPSHPRRLGRP